MQARPAFAVLFRSVVVLWFAVCVLCACAQRPTPTATSVPYPADNPLVGAALDTVIRFNQSGGAAGKTTEVPEEFWAPEIEALEPRGVYWHNNNLAVLLGESDAGLDGLYIYVPISSYMPQEEITELQIGQRVYRLRVTH